MPLRSRSAVFSESDSAPCALPFSFSQGSVRKNSRQMILAAGDKRAHVGSMPACLAVIAEREHSSVLFTQRDQRPSTVSDMISFGVSDGEIDDRFYFYFLAASDAEVCSGSVTNPALLTSSSSRNARLGADEELICIITKGVNELGLEWSLLRSHLAAGWTIVYSLGDIKVPLPLLPLGSYELTISWHAPHTSRIRPSASVALTSVDSASHATHPVLAETKGSIRGLASRTPPRNGDSGLCISLGPMEGPFLAKRGVILDTAHRRKVVMTDTSNKGWGALCKGKPSFGLWSEEESGLHINCLEMLAVCQACHFFLPDIPGHHVLIRSDSRSVVSNINHQGSLVSKRLCVLANDLLVWAQNNLRSLKATHLPCKMNRGADMLSRNNVSSEEWMLHPLVVQRICETFGRA